MALFDQDFDRILTAVLEADEKTTFVELAKIAELNPGTDFQHCDLADNDFSNCDLRGFNFTGADLRRAHGDNVIWDETTILRDADVEGSIFEKERDK